MTRTCATCGRTWGRRAAFCGACGDLLDTSLAARPDDLAPAGWWHRPAVAGALAVAGVVGVVAAVPAVSIGGPPPVDGEVGMPSVDELQAAPGALAAPRRAVAPPALTCSGPEDPSDCVLWSRALAPPLEAGSSSQSWVVAKGDRVVVATDEHLEGVDADTGTRLWRVARAPEAFPLGVGREVLVLGDDQVLEVVDLDDGTRLWSTRTNTIDSLMGSPAFLPRASGDELVVTGPPSSLDGPGVAARDARDGTVRWTWRGPRDGGGLYVRTLDDDRLLVGFSGSRSGFVVLDARTGAELHRVTEDVGAWIIDVVGDVAVTLHDRNRPSRSRGGDPGGFLRGIDITSDDTVWEQPVRALDTGIQLVSNLALVPTARHLTAIDVRTGEIVWEVSTERTEQVAGTHLWGRRTAEVTTPDVVVTFLHGDTAVQARDPRTASLVWRRELPATVQYAAMTRDEVVVVTDDGFHVLDATTGEDRRVWSVRPIPMVERDPLVLYDPQSGHVVRLADAAPSP